MTRIIALFDDYQEDYVETDAPAEEIETAIQLKTNALLSDQEIGSDFEYIQKLLNEKGYVFTQATVEKFYW